MAPHSFAFIRGDRRVALRIDVDTLRGTRDGVPAMLEDLRTAGVRASFYFSLGPDRSGRAIFRAFTKRGFVRKMVRTNALKMYGFRSALYGTLWAAPNISDHCSAILRACEQAGHEVGLHAWDHVQWQDGLYKLSRQAVRELLLRGVSAFEEIFRRPPRAFAAPGWFCTDDGWEILETLSFDYVSVTRGAVKPFFPFVRGRALRILEVPTTLATFDEEIGRGGVNVGNYTSGLLRRCRQGENEVLTVHAETEGIAYRNLFRELLARHKHHDIQMSTVGELASAARAGALIRAVTLGSVPGRAGEIVVPARQVEEFKSELRT